MKAIPKSALSFQESQPARPSGLLARLHIDLPLLTGLLLLAAVGLGVLYSAGDHNMALMQKQMIRLSVGFFALILLAQIHPDHLRRWSPVLYLIGILMLLAVILFGEAGKGAQRWLDLGLSLIHI